MVDKLTHIFNYKNVDYRFRPLQMDELMGLGELLPALFEMETNAQTETEIMKGNNTKEQFEMAIKFSHYISKLSVDDPPVKFNEWKPYDFMAFISPFMPFMMAELFGIPKADVSVEDVKKKLPVNP